MRQPIAAGRFYPEQKKALLAELERLYANTEAVKPRPCKAAVVPHAGYIYSGRLAASTLAQITIPSTVLLIGPKHTPAGASLALAAKNWITPLGMVRQDTALSEAIAAQSEFIKMDDLAHENEHSLEVILPLLQYRQPDLAIAALAIGFLSYDDCVCVAEWLSAAIRVFEKKHQPLLLLASSDMNHFEEKEACRAKDTLALSAIDQMDPQGLYRVVADKNISMCGVVPVVITMLVLQQLGHGISVIAGYSDSSAASGDTSQVVGYAGILFS